MTRTASIDVDRLRILAQTMTLSEIVRETGWARNTVTRYVQQHGIERHRHASLKYTDLAQRAQEMHLLALARHYGVTAETMKYALQRRGITPVVCNANQSSKYDDLAERCKRMTSRELAEHYECSPSAINRALKVRGLKSKPGDRVYIHRMFSRVATKNVRNMRAKQLVTHFAPGSVTDNRPKSEADLAQNFLQKECAVFRCTETGQADPTGKFYKRGSRILTPDELIAMATRKGWKPESWKALAA